MNKVQVLDCTLRDGGYCNNWDFGLQNARTITHSLVEANVEIIECGFLTQLSAGPDLDSTKFATFQEVSRIIPEERNGKLFVAMINFGEYDIEDIPEHQEGFIDGVRVAFHKKNMHQALDLCQKIMSKGYLVFVQPMVSLSYSDEEFISLIKSVNEFNPYAFYIVDSFGMMKAKDLIRLFYMIEHNLNESVWIGFHSHNNMQLAYSNAQALVNIQTNRDIIIDSSIMGMGRGAGNLNTELFVDFLNENLSKDYIITPLLYVIDKILTAFYERNYWGYSLPNYISALHNAHPNYAGYLDLKKTLTFEDMNEIFNMMHDEDKKSSYDKNYIEDLYLKYQEKDRVLIERLNDFKEQVYGKRVLIVASGRTSVTEKDKVMSYAGQPDVVTVSVNKDFNASVTDYIFISNLRRFRDISADERKKSIVTSNISATGVFLQVRYKDLLNSHDLVKDNAALMLIKFLISQGVQKILLAGLDGYYVNEDQAYSNQMINSYFEYEIAKKKNAGVTDVLKELHSSVDIQFITTPKYITLG